MTNKDGINPESVRAGLVERVCVAMCRASRPNVDPYGQTPASRGVGGMEPTWKIYEHLACAAIEAQERAYLALSERVGELEGHVDDLQQAEAEYRTMHDRHGDGSRAAGRAWDLMRRAGDKARAALSHKGMDHG